MDLTSSIIAVATVGVKLSTTLYSYSNGVAKAEKDITDIAADVALTSNVLNRVGDFMTQAANAPVASEDAVRDAQSIIQRCERIFGEIEDGFSKRMKSKKDRAPPAVSIFGKASWPLKGPRVELLCRKLDGLKLSLTLLLEVLSLAANRDAWQMQSSAAELEREKIRRLHIRQQQSHKDELSLIREIERLDLIQAGKPSFSSPIGSRGLDPAPYDDAKRKRMALPDRHSWMSLPQSSHDRPLDQHRLSFSYVESSEEEDSHLEPPLTALDLEKCANYAHELLSKIEETHSFVLYFHPRRKRCRRRLRKAFFRFQNNFEDIVLRGDWQNQIERHLGMYEEDANSITEAVAMRQNSDQVREADVEAEPAGSYESEVAIDFDVEFTRGGLRTVSRTQSKVSDADPVDPGDSLPTAPKPYSSKRLPRLFGGFTADTPSNPSQTGQTCDLHGIACGHSDAPSYLLSCEDGGESGRPYSVESNSRPTHQRRGSRERKKPRRNESPAVPQAPGAQDSTNQQPSPSALVNSAPFPFPALPLTRKMSFPSLPSEPDNYGTATFGRSTGLAEDQTVPIEDLSEDIVEQLLRRWTTLPRGESGSGGSNNSGGIPVQP